MSLQAALPLAILGGLHLEQITDLAWSPDGLTLIISSYDGYCRQDILLLIFFAPLYCTCGIWSSLHFQKCCFYWLF